MIRIKLHVFIKYQLYKISYIYIVKNWIDSLSCWIRVLLVKVVSMSLEGTDFFNIYRRHGAESFLSNLNNYN